MSGDLIADIRDNVGQLAVSSAIWDYRGDKPDAFHLKARNDAVDAIDAMMRDLHKVRAQLVAEGRKAQDELNARVDARLAATRPS